MSGRLYYELQDREQENANQTLFAMQGFLHLNDILQKAISNGYMESYELSSIQHQIIYTQSTFDKTRHLFIDELNNEKYHIFSDYLTALEDIIYKIENINPLDKEILNALITSDSVSGERYEYDLAEYMQLMATKIEEAIARLNIQELSVPDVEGIITIYPKMSEIKKLFLGLFE